MNIPHLRLAATAFLAALAFYPHSAIAEKFTGKTFAERSRESQDAYIQISITMAGVVASQTKPSVSKCIDDWYVKGDGNLEIRNASIREIIAKYPNHHPSAVIFAALKRRCGAFK